MAECNRCGKTFYWKQEGSRYIPYDDEQLTIKHRCGSSGDGGGSQQASAPAGEVANAATTGLLKDIRGHLGLLNRQLAMTHELLHLVLVKGEVFDGLTDDERARICPSQAIQVGEPKEQEEAPSSQPAESSAGRGDIPF